MAENRPDTPLAESPKLDAMALSSKLKQIQTESNARVAANYAARKAAIDKKRQAISSKSSKGSGGPQGLNTTFGGKIVK